MSLPTTLPDTLDELLEPISAEAPCGISLRYDPDLDRLRELRREDDASLPAGVWQTELKRGDWAALEQLAATLLRERSKDLMVAAWLGEAWLHRNGLAGLGQALALLDGLCERYPETLHPLPVDGDKSWRAAPLEWVVRRYAEVLLTRLPLFGAEHPDIAHITLYGWQQLHLRQVQASDSKADKAAAEAARLEGKKLREALAHFAPAALLKARDNMDTSLRDLDRLDRWCDEWLGEAAPSSGPLRQVMGAIRTLMQEFIAMHPQPQAAATPSAEPAGPGEAEPDLPKVPVTGFGSREEAYRQLALIADYLARTEPHSPVPYLIRRAVEWGNQPLANLLDELINSDAEARRIWKLLGVLK